ncbi:MULTISPECIES: TetR/AcrR family transcriptional regulator [Ralstonia solanacearum species complex]|uniref:TetR family transcriptional regulator n=1 Tax=Ralstonia syzygii TaxID=28097 RepID=A0ABX7ZFR0_9RALS|nr:MULTISPECIES: TetR/AcrR family transcriptional regulator [Ralstonia solanacearum species complex]BEU72616.1 TetR/AcrR family transcriptional regulator [Ralstonia pseudosolanacearum]AXV77464.1 TetR family transcriptional regulator [Ralstonia solanacearum]AXV91483.1 TetR family transcriptional regulator [Ralstonia solanacearum]AXW19607.1 TetR family transcriptional regulator [Ralstonia solanacearum]AXW76379.1 TetR family transcriptional regulator [Ralstonia solanacearum]
MPDQAPASIDTKPRSGPPRERILSTAYDLFYRDGIRATGIDRVIAESGVTKVTFYRHFPSKNDLIRAFLDHRHARWIAWFSAALVRHGGNLQALPDALAEWFDSPAFRGCAFLNSVAELGGTLPEVKAVTRRHKEEVAAIIAQLLPDSAARQRNALALCVAVDGAIARASYDPSPDAAIQALRTIVDAVAAV